MEKKIMMFAAVFCLYAPLAMAGDPYVGIRGGMAQVADSDLDNPSQGVVIKTEFDPGWTISGFVGMELATKYRVEVEIGYQASEVSNLSVPGEVRSGSGELSAVTYMGTVYYDFRVDSPVTPFIGLGAGYADLDFDSLSYEGSTSPAESANDSSFAWQLIAGFGYAVNKATTVDVFYRYLNALDVRFGVADAEFDSHNITLGVRTKF